MDAAVRLDWNTVTVYNNSPAAMVLPTAFGLHWEHTREHHKEKGESNGGTVTRSINEGIAARHGGLGHYGRLQGASLLLDQCDLNEFILSRRFDYDARGVRLPALPGLVRPVEGLIIPAKLISRPTLTQTSAARSRPA